MALNSDVVGGAYRAADCKFADGSYWDRATYPTSQRGLLPHFRFWPKGDIEGLSANLTYRSDVQSERKSRKPITAWPSQGRPRQLYL